MSKATQGMTPNLIKALKNTLEERIRSEVEKDITETLVAEYRIAVGSKLKPMVKQITIATLEHFRNMSHMRDDFEVYVKVRNQENEPHD